MVIDKIIKEDTMRDRKKRNIIIGSLCCLLVFMAVGYALLSQTLNINGIANLTGKWKIYIDSITVKEVGGSAKSNQAEVTEDKLTANFDVELLKPGDYVEYDVVVKNEGTINAVLRELIPNIESNNMDILLTHSIIQGQILKAESETKFTLKIRFDERATEIVSGGQTSFDIQMVYEQYDGDASDIDPSLVPVTANDCFTVDENGVITEYDYSCGTYVTVPAVVNGTTVTEISATAFIQGNAVVYVKPGDQLPSIVVAQDSDTYTEFSSLLESMGGTSATGISVFMKGDTLPDTTALMEQKGNIDSNAKFTDGISVVEYLDLSQANGLNKIARGAFVSDTTEPTLKHLNLEGVKPNVVEAIAFNYANLDTLTIDTDIYSLIRDKFNATIDTLRIYPGTTTEIPEFPVDHTNYKITVNNLIIGEGITRIGNSAFREDTYGTWIIKNVELPESLIEIGDKAFYNSNIASVSLPSNLKIIGEGAFQSVELTSLVIPASVESIGDSSFSTGSLTSLKFEENSKLTYIGSGAFTGNKLTSIDFSPVKQKFEIGDNAFNGDNSNITTVVIDDVILGYFVFNDNLKSMELIGDIEFNSINPLGNYGEVVRRLTNLKIKSDTLKEIPPNAFGFEYPITTSTLEFLNEEGTEVNSSIKTIGDSAFMRAAPTTLILPTSLETIGQNAFEHANPTTFVMSPVIKNVGYSAFYRLTIESLTIPSTIESIGSNAFQSMPSTSTITVNKGEGSFTTGDSWSGSANVVYNP